MLKLYTRLLQASVSFTSALTPFLVFSNRRDNPDTLFRQGSLSHMYLDLLIK